MKLTKYTHACFVLEMDGKKIIVDPGGFTDLPDDLSGFVAIIITHEHGDHFSPDNLMRIKSANPEAQLFAAEEISAVTEGATTPVRENLYQVGPFNLKFGGDLHALIHSDIPRIHNLTVSINGVYYPGDSYDLPDEKANIVMLPFNAPWASIGATIDFVRSANGARFIPTHDSLLSETGLNVYGSIKGHVETTGASYQRLAPGESTEV